MPQPFSIQALPGWDQLGWGFAERLEAQGLRVGSRAAAFGRTAHIIRSQDAELKFKSDPQHAVVFLANVEDLKESQLVLLGHLIAEGALTCVLPPPRFRPGFGEEKPLMPRPIALGMCAQTLNRFHLNYCAGFYGAGGRWFRARVNADADGLQVSDDDRHWIDVPDEAIAFHGQSLQPIDLPDIPERTACGLAMKG